MAAVLTVRRAGDTRRLVDSGATLRAAWQPREAASMSLRPFPAGSCESLVLTPALRLTSKKCCPTVTQHSAPCQDLSVPET